MGGKKKQSLKKIERTQTKKGEGTEAKEVEAPSRREKKTAGIIPPDSRSEKIAKEVKKMKTLTPFAVASRFNLRLSVAKDLLEELEKNGVIRFVSRSRNLKIYAPVD